MTAPAYTLRAWVEGDAETLAILVRELASFEKLDAHAGAVAEDFRVHLFGPNPSAEAVLAEVGGRPVGFALFFTTFSTFRGKPGLYLEDLYVRQNHRGRGIGKALLGYVAGQAVRRGYARVEWSVLNWNAAAIDFYRAAGAKPMEEWTVYRLDDEALGQFALSLPELPRTTRE